MRGILENMLFWTFLEQKVMKTTKSQKKLEIPRDGVRNCYGTPSANFDKGLEWTIRDALRRNFEDSTRRRPPLETQGRLV